MTTVDELQQARLALELETARAAGERIAYAWMKRHIADFDQSVESQTKPKLYMDDHGLPFTEESLERAFTALTAMGVKFTTPPAAPVEEELPPVPPYLQHIKTRKDIDSIPHDKYREWCSEQRCPDSRAFKARVNEILRRGV
jgi:hypothetical protein